jgi:hypothetical protein
MVHQDEPRFKQGFIIMKPYRREELQKMIRDAFDKQGWARSIWMIVAKYAATGAFWSQGRAQMQGLAKEFFLVGIMFAIAGMMLGLQIAMSGDHIEMPVHAHIMVAG